MAAAEVPTANRACDLDLGLKDRRASYNLPIVDSVGNGMALPTSSLLLRHVIDGLCSIFNQGRSNSLTQRRMVETTGNELPLPDSSAFLSQAIDALESRVGPGQMALLEIRWLLSCHGSRDQHVSCTKGGTQEPTRFATLEVCKII